MISKYKLTPILLNGFFFSLHVYAACPSSGSTLNAPTGVASDSNCNVSVSGGNFGVVVNNGSQYTLIDSNVSTTGNGGYGVTVLGNNATFTAHGLILTTTGSFVPSHYALGMLIQQNVGVTIDDRVNTLRESSISTSGAGSTTIVVSPNATLNLYGRVNPIFIGASGTNANGVQQETGSQVIANNVLVETSGNNGYAIDMYYTIGFTSPVYDGTNNVIRTFGDDGYILSFSRGGTMTFRNTQLSSMGTNSYGMRNQSSVNPNNLTLINSILTTDKATAFYLTGTAQTTINLSDGTQITPGNGILMDAYSSANVAFNAQNNVRLTGNVLVDNSSIVAMNLVGSFWSGAADNVNNLDLSGSEWLLTGDSNILNTITNAGTIRFGGDDAFKMLTTTNYEGNNGTLLMRTELNSDNSPSDALIIDGGTASGTTNLLVMNDGGLGARTQADGILIVSAINGGTSDSNAFSQSVSTVAGPYKYTLYRGNLDGSMPDNWYLRSSLIIDPVDPLDPANADPIVSEFRRELSLYNSIMPTAALYGRRVIDTLHQRVGDEELLRGRTNPLVKNRFANGVWGRVIGFHGHWRGKYYGTYQGAPESKFDFGAGQLGVDLYRNEEKNGQRDHIGVYGAYGQSTEHLDHKGLTNLYVGSDHFNAYSFAGYWTHFGASGWYLDGVVQGTYYDNKVKFNFDAISDFQGHYASVTPGEWGVGLSLEGGYPIALNNAWILEPQAQIVYQNISLNSFYDGSATVRFQDLDSVAGRFGGRLIYDGFIGSETKKKEYRAWMRANAWREFNARPATQFMSVDGPISYSSNLKESWGQFGLGADVRVNPLCYLYGSFDYQTTFQRNTYGYEGVIGVRSHW